MIIIGMVIFYLVPILKYCSESMRLFLSLLPILQGWEGIRNEQTAAWYLARLNCDKRPYTLHGN